MSSWDLIKKGFGVATKSRDLLLALFGFGFVWNLINIPLAKQAQAQGATEATVSVAIVVLSVIFIILSIFMQSGSLGYIRDSLKTGQSNLGTFAESGRKYYLRILGIGLVIALLVIIISILTALIFVAIGAAPAFVRAAVGALFVVLGIALVLFLFLAPYACVCDEAKIIDSLKASIAVAKKYFWRLFLTGLLLVLVLFLIGFLLGLLVGLLAQAITGVFGQVIFGFFSSIVNAFFGIVVTGTFMAFYLGAKSQGTASN